MKTETIFYRKLPVTRITKKEIKPIFPYEIPFTQIPKLDNAVHVKPQILFITSYPPRECGIANYSIDLIDAIEAKYAKTFDIKICALETNEDHHLYPPQVNHSLNTENGLQFNRMALEINNNPNIEMVLIQHEFGFFHQKENHFENMIKMINKNIIIVFHTVLPNPDHHFKAKVQRIVLAVNAVVVMTNNASKILSRDYQIDPQKITVIPHGTHLVPHLDRISLKEKYNFKGRPIMATFGLLSSGKSIETSLKALPKIIAENKNILFLIIGKTHPTIIQREGEIYRNKLEALVIELNLEKNVQFINQYLSSELLLEYLQMTDIYLFTSKDPNQAVSGTFAYAISCGCAVISTPIPHALEVIGNDAGLIIDFENNQQLSEAAIQLLRNENKLETIRQNGLHKMNSTSWQNSAIRHGLLFENLSNNKLKFNFSIPPINLKHLQNLTTSFGMIQFSKLNNPDINSGYTLDDNARALIVMCMHFEKSGDENDLKYIRIYLNLINFCHLENGNFLNYIDEEQNFTTQNEDCNLSDANGRAIWALGFLCSKYNILPSNLVIQAETIIASSLNNIEKMRSTRAMAFSIKGLYYSNQFKKTTRKKNLIITLADRIVNMYKHESDTNWKWFESYLTYANSTLPEAMLFAYLETDKEHYKKIANDSFEFLLSIIFKNNEIKVISNKGWHFKGKATNSFGEQPIDVAYTILALNSFYQTYKNPDHLVKMKIAYNWFLGNNHLHQIIYNPCTGGCFDGLEENYVNLNQGAESTVSHLLSRLTLDFFQESSPRN